MARQAVSSGVMPSNRPADGAPAPPADPAYPASTAAPRKRRKRTAGSGAAEDCFTCASRGTKCDRRRPYCTQCLDLGKDCSGYKTTLTWGVGVASRGKLRGLSLPVSGGQAVAPQKPRKQSTSGNEAKPQQSRSKQESSADSSETVSATQKTETQSPPSDPMTNPPVLDGLPPQPPFSQPGLVISDPFPNQLSSDGGGVCVPDYQQGISSTSGDLSAQPWVPALDTSTGYQQQTGSLSIEPNPAPVLAEWPPAVTGKRRAADEEEDDDVVEQVYSESSVYSNQSPVSTYSQSSWSFLQSPFAISLPDLLLEQSVGRTPRIRFLISYFVEVIAPVIVAFDSPTNPYRTRILRLAQQSETLQHAIAALAASNLRQRREAKIMSTERTEPARMSSIAHRALTDTSFQDRYGIRDPQDPTREELYHKSMAIKSLNAQLADPVQRHQDSVLATLLILCLFHICETGVAQFQTQFAGVRKLLAMRRRGRGIQSEEARWCTRMFTWFDAFTATINNREGQLQGAYLDMACLSDEEWAMENLAGCDGRLFKIIARLGRLNMLSQRRPVDSSAGNNVFAATPIVPPSLSHYTTMNTPPPSAVPVDGAADPFAPWPPGCHHPSDQSDRAEFWAEWHSVRQQLESWRLDTTAFAGGYDASWSPNSCASSATFSPPLSPTSAYFVAPSNFVDLSNISESFRYSALLYTERLAFPDIPSSHPRIQSLVLTALHYISAVHSDVYLLWPLFVTGAECVYDEHREQIRRRCKDIQKDSGFFNNISCLELLEKIWAKNPSIKAGDDLSTSNFGGLSSSPVSNVRESSEWQAPNSTKLCLRPSSGFKWRSIIENEGLDGEYMVV
ncbi:hypothetical protein T310_5218 [Rasamsonia emersonii CBS 393.64]|uniref:Zn(2)-C6 fungal-type domain-containing protein n=1 Tax=Rasamsonia emersonii (strain ATCC 16479 / CBS 393.64 / IMI 116815) TaxID=1408163 RepID=A0A0F4YT02_RASE3|nr:hypothetical protein T310_5218 [Rasamsonia emersonii CBS 393.64]KKA20753.1 hypothetical protein T310_5218 [Rasamsonia emersonii CBS 393.64]